MKTKLFSITIALLFIFSNTIFGQVAAINTFYKKHKKIENATNISIPAWLIDLGVGIAVTTLDDDEEKAALKLAKKIQKIKLLIIEEKHAIKSTEVQELIHQLSSKQFERLMTIKDDGTDITFMMREKKDKIKNLLILVSEEDEFIMVSLKTKIKISDINHLIKLMKAQDSFDVFPKEDAKEEVQPELIRA